MLSLRVLPSTGSPESTPLIGGQLVLLKGDWQTENCTLRFHPSFVAVVLPLVNSPPCLRQTEALSISCWLGGWVGRLRRDGGGDGGRKTILHLSTLRENQSCHHKWEVWMNFISWFLSCSRRWLSDWPVPLIGFLNDPWIWKERRFGKHFNKRNRTVVSGLQFPTLLAATMWETSSGFSWQSGNRFTIWLCAKPVLGFVKKCFSTIFRPQQIWWSVIKGSSTPLLQIYFIIFSIISQGHRWALKAS